MAQLIAHPNPTNPKLPWLAFMNFKSAHMERSKDDGCLYIRDVVGTSEALDRDGEVVDYESAKSAMDDYMNRTGHESGPLRRQHMGDSGGRVIAWRGDDDKKQILIDLKIIGQETIELVENGGYTGVSIAFRRAYKDGKRLVVKAIGEWALVDNEANPESALPIAKAEQDTDRKGLGLVQYFVGCLANLISVREQLKWEKQNEGDESELPAKADQLARDAAEMARDMFEEEIAEALGDMDEAEQVAGMKALSELVGIISSKAAKLGGAAKDIKGAVLSARDSYETAAKRLKEAPVTKAEQDAVALKAAQDLLDAQVEVDMKAGKDGTAAMSAHHQTHAKALHGLHGDMTDHHKALGDVLASHEKSMHPDAHKALSAVHGAMGKTLKAHAAHAAHAGKMTGGKKNAEVPVTDTKDITPAMTAAEITALVESQVTAQVAIVKKDSETTIKSLNEQIEKLKTDPAPHPLASAAGGSGPVKVEKALGALDRLFRASPEFGEEGFQVLYAGARRAAAPAAAPGQGGR